MPKVGFELSFPWSQPKVFNIQPSYLLKKYKHTYILNVLHYKFIILLKNEIDYFM
jgi:hypothetical protein